MDSFWKWMREKGYSTKLDRDNFIYPKGSTLTCTPTKQMLIGYMMEYCFINDIVFNIDDTNVYKIMKEAITNNPTHV